MTCSRTAGLALACLLAVCSTSPGTARADQSACDPVFPYRDGWLGGDGAYSVPLSPTQSLWLFGDSFVLPDTGAPPNARGAPTRAQAAFVANTIGISSCIDGAWTIRYAWGGTPTAPAAFFGTETPQVRYWPLDGFVDAGGVLTVFLMRIETLDPGNPLGFAVTGTDLVRIGNPDAPPDDWEGRVVPLTRGHGALPGAALWREDGHVVLAAPVAGAADHPVFLARLPLDRLDQGAAALQSWRPGPGGGAWIDGFDPEDLSAVIAQGAAEMSLARGTGPDAWIAVQMAPDPFSPHIAWRHAPSPLGPWSPADPLFTVPEPGASAYLGAGVFCYGAKAHPQFRRDGTMLVTYACNATDLDRLMTDLTLYYPKAVRLPLPQPLPVLAPGPDRP